jgi:hypothetical protein
MCLSECAVAELLLQVESIDNKPFNNRQGPRRRPPSDLSAGPCQFARGREPLRTGCYSIALTGEMRSERTTLPVRRDRQVAICNEQRRTAEHGYAPPTFRDFDILFFG